MLTNAHFKPFFHLLEIPNIENRHLRQQGHDPDHRETKVGRVQEAARNRRRPDRRQNHRRAGGGRADH